MINDILVFLLRHSFLIKALITAKNYNPNPWNRVFFSSCLFVAQLHKKLIDFY